MKAIHTNSEYVKGSANQIVQDSIDKFKDQDGKRLFSSIVKDLIQQKVPLEKIKSGMYNLRIGYTVGQSRKFINEQIDFYQARKDAKEMLEIIKNEKK